MKFIFAFLVIFILTPIYGETTCTTANTTSGCSTGCFDSGLGECAQCQTGYYNDGNFTSCQSCEGDSNYNTIISDPTKQHPDGASSCSDWECVDDYFPVDTNGDGTPDECSACDPTTLPQNAQFTDSCTWRCNTGFYKNGNACNSCPSNSTTTAPGATNVSQCQCEQNKYLTQNNGEYICKSCPQHSFTYNSGSTSITDCQCEAQYYMGGANDNQCISCPEHGNCAYAGRTYLTATCANNYQKNIDTTNHTFSCDDCSDSNATFDGTICKCNANYYGEPNGLNTTCTACPAGTTGEAGATAKSACHMTQNTKFCDANGKCMKLLQNATNINQ